MMVVIEESVVVEMKDSLNITNLVKTGPEPKPNKTFVSGL